MPNSGLERRTEARGTNRLDDFTEGVSAYSRAELTERVLDRGVVVDATHVVTVAHVHLATIDTWLVIASLSTYEELTASEAGMALGLAPLPWKRSEQEGPSSRRR